jgi:hypothetical protein
MAGTTILYSSKSLMGTERVNFWDKVPSPTSGRGAPPGSEQARTPARKALVCRPIMLIGRVATVLYIHIGHGRARAAVFRQHNLAYCGPHRRQLCHTAAPPAPFDAVSINFAPRQSHLGFTRWSRCRARSRPRRRYQHGAALCVTGRTCCLRGGADVNRALDLDGDASMQRRCVSQDTPAL